MGYCFAWLLNENFCSIKSSLKHRGFIRYMFDCIPLFFAIFSFLFKDSAVPFLKNFVRG